MSFPGWASLSKKALGRAIGLVAVVVAVAGCGVPLVGGGSGAVCSAQPQRFDGFAHDSMLITGTDAGLEARGLTSGEPAWSTELPGSGPFSPSWWYATDEVVEVAGPDGWQVVRAGDGAVLFERDVDSFAFSASDGDGGCIAYLTEGSSQPSVVAVSVDSGEQRWTRPGRAGVSTASGDVHVIYQVNSARVISSLSGVDGRTGGELWENRVGAREFRIFDEVVVHWDDFGEITALDALTGDQLWSASSPGGDDVTYDAASGTLLAFTDWDEPGERRVIVAFDLEKGTERWRRDDIAYGPTFVTTSSGSGVAAMFHEGRAQVLALLDVETGRELWFTSGQDLVGRPCEGCVDRVVQVTPDVLLADGGIGVDVESGEVLWTSERNAGLDRHDFDNGAGVADTDLYGRGQVNAFPSGSVVVIRLDDGHVGVGVDSGDILWSTAG